MEIQMTQQVARIFEETEKMTLTEKQSLFWIMVERWGQENVLSYNTTNTNQMLITVPKYLEIRKFGNENNPAKMFLNEVGKFENVDFSDIEEEEIYLQNI